MPADQTGTERTVEPLMALSSLHNLAFQRKVLDWRDNAHADMTMTMGTLYRAFIDHIDRRLQHERLLDVGLYGRLFPIPADEALQHELTHTYLHGLKFKPSEREMMVQNLRAWMLGPDGLSANFRNQATHIANQLTQISENS